jgi:hypothetical protein
MDIQRTGKWITNLSNVIDGKGRRRHAGTSTHRDTNAQKHRDAETPTCRDIGAQTLNPVGIE